MKSLSIERRRGLCGYVFILPWAVGFALLILFPLGSNLLISFSKSITGAGQAFPYELIGARNYVQLFTEDVTFLPALWDTLVATFVWTPFILVFSLFLAVLLNRRIRLRGLFRVIFFLPVLLGSGHIMQQLTGASNILQLPYSVSSFVAYYFNADIADFLTTLLEEIMRMFWKSGVQIVIFLSGLQSISETYYEAARVDNASGWQCFWKITLPILSPIILLNAVYTVVESLRSTDNKIGELIINHYNAAGDPAYSAAMGWVFFLISALLIGLLFLVARRAVVYEK